MKRRRSGLGPLSRPHILLGAVVIAGFAIGGCTSSARIAEPTTPSRQPSLASSSAGAERTTTRTALGPRRCTASDLRAELSPHGGQASHTFSLLVLINQSKAECSVNGYPSITAIGHTASGRADVLPIAIQHGTYFRPDPGPHLVSLAHGQSASCVVETELAYSGGANPDTITELKIALPGSNAAQTIKVGLGATGPPGEPVPILITALVAGVNGPTQGS